MRYRLLFFLIAIAVALAVSTVSCRDAERTDSQNTGGSAGGKTMESFSKVGGAKIFFGHQSVGENILEGIRGLMQKHPEMKLEVVESSDPAAFSKPVLAHAKIGRNSDPKSKIDAFAAMLDSGIGERADIAMMKLCYVDILSRTDVQDIFAYYKASMDRIKREYPRLKVVHMTVPLTAVQSGPVAIVKKALGRLPGGYLANVERSRFNNLLRREYPEPGSLFDLAEVESLSPQGKTQGFVVGGAEYRAMVPAYTSDGGHLNALGKEVVATRLVRFLEAISP